MAEIKTRPATPEYREGWDWLAEPELTKLRAELAEIRANVDAMVNMAYVNGYHAGRAIGHVEMLTHLRGDPDERVTAEIMQRRAAEMVH